MTVHQALHGYGHGHERMACTLSLSRAADSLMLVLSDISGPEIAPGFETYLTGYPLPDADFYVLARTWYAPEMPRPGTVWTHSLLVDATDLAHLRDLSPLLARFRRPRGPKDVAHYSRALRLDEPPPAGEGDDEPTLSGPSWAKDGAARPVRSALAAALLEALYGDPTSPIFVSARRAEEVEPLVLRLWAQQWPRLRREFRFCTGSIEDRASQGVAFDLQVIPERSERAAQRSGGRARLIRAREVNGEAEAVLRAAGPVGDLSTAWLAAALRDLGAEPVGRAAGDAPPRRGLAAFLRAFAAEVRPPRAGFLPYADVYASLPTRGRANAAAAVALVERMALHFGARGSGARLKVALLGGDESPGRDWFRSDERALLMALAASTRQDAFDAEALDLRRRARAFAEAPAGARDLLAQPLPPSGPVAREIAEGAANTAPAETLVDRALNDAAAARWVLDVRPDVAAAAALWKKHPSLHARLLEAMRSGRAILEPGLVPVYARALLDHWDAAVHPARLAREALDVFGTDGVVAVLRWVDTAATGGAALPADWRGALSARAADLAWWVGESSADHVSAWTAASLVDPEPQNAAVLGSGWAALAMARAVPAGVDHETGLRARAAAVAFGFRARNRGAAELLGPALAALYAAAERDALPESAWRVVGRQLPRPERGWEWDRCALMRRALAERLRDGRLAPAEFIAAGYEDRILERTVRELAAEKGGGDAVRRLAEWALSHPRDVPRGVAKALADADDDRTFFGLIKKTVKRK